MTTHLKNTVDKLLGDVLKHDHTDLVDIYNDQTINGNKTLNGNIILNGTFTANSAFIVHTENISVSANHITLNNNLTGSPFEDAGIIVNRGNESDSILEWNEAVDRWQVGLSANPMQNIMLGSDILPITADIQNIAQTSGNWISKDLSGNINNINGIQFDTTPITGAHSMGKLYYDTEFGTFTADIGEDVRLQIGQETMCYVYNNTANPITNGKVVYITGSYNGVPTIALANATTESTSFALGVVTNSSIAINSYGYVTIRGHVNSLNTSSWTVGTSLYLSSTPGELTSTAPSEGNFDVRIGRVMIQDSSNGRIYVNIRPMSRLTDLGDVTINTPSTDQVLRYNGTEWVNGNPVTSSTSVGIEFFPDDTSIIPAGTESLYPIKNLSKTPITTAEDVDTISLNSNTVMYGSYLYDNALNRTTIDAGIWTFNVYAAVNNAGGITSLRQNINRVRIGTGTITTTALTSTSRTATASSGTPFAATEIDVGGTIDSASFLRTTTGLFRILTRVSDTVVTIEVPSTYTNQTNVAYSVHKRLFQISTGEINNTATSPLFTGLQLYSVKSAQPAYTILATDKLSNTFFGVSDTNARSVYFAHNGNTRYSYFSTPLITLHNNLAGLNGGTNNEMYHLTLAQHTIATQAASNITDGYITTGTQSLSGVKTFSNFPLTPSLAPTTDYQVANKKYVDDNIGTGGAGTTLVELTLDHNSDSNDWGKLYVYVQSTSANRTFNVTTAVSKNGSAPIIVKNESNYSITIDPNSTETIDGNLIQIIDPGETIIMYSDNTNLRSL